MKPFYSLFTAAILVAIVFNASPSLAEAAPAQAPPAQAPPASSAFDQILEHYEAVRLALTQDTVQGVSEHSAQISTIVTDLESKKSLKGDNTDELQALLPDLKQAAASLTTATSLKAARDAFYELSKPMVRFRKSISGDKPVVAYCSMAKRSWLQPAGKLANPYYGQSMLRCGEIVDG